MARAVGPVKPSRSANALRSASGSAFSRMSVASGPPTVPIAPSVQVIASGKVIRASRKFTSTHSESSQRCGSVSGVSIRRTHPAPARGCFGSGVGRCVPRIADCRARSAAAKPRATSTPPTRIGSPTHTTTVAAPAESRAMTREKPIAPSTRARNE